MRRRRCDVNVTLKSMGNSRFARSILAVFVELRRRPHFTAIDEIAVELHRAVFGKKLTLIRDLVAADHHAVSRPEFLRERLARATGEYHGKERQRDAAMRNRSAEAQHPATPADDRRPKKQDGGRCQHERPQRVDARHERECRTEHEE